MTMPINAIGGFAGITGLSGSGTLLGSRWMPPIPDAGDDDELATTGPNAEFAKMLARGIARVSEAQTTANDLAVKVADGTLSDPSQYTIAATEASLALQLVISLRNKGLEAFQEIMRMQA
ncbi:hypothetical protein Acsp01_36400 [Actinoplanes sp. NBRC 101535]|nr:hypothetical protein Acsp01_36400 [Actinoplanes sp. NBRC 101535]